MSNMCCYRKIDCVTLALLVSIALGIVVAFLTITGALAIGTVALIVAFGIAVGYLAAALAAAGLSRQARTGNCVCTALRAVLAGILVTILTALLLLAIPFAATSFLGAIITGLLAAGFALMLTASACLVKCLLGCTEQ